MHSGRFRALQGKIYIQKSLPSTKIYQARRCPLKSLFWCEHIKGSTIYSVTLISVRLIRGIEDEPFFFKQVYFSHLKC